MMKSQPNPERTVHFPPEYNLRGRKQLWFIEGTAHDDLLNGMLTALLFLAPIVGISNIWTLL